MLVLIYCCGLSVFINLQLIRMDSSHRLRPSMRPSVHLRVFRSGVSPWCHWVKAGCHSGTVDARRGKQRDAQHTTKQSHSCVCPEVLFRWIPGLKEDSGGCERSVACLAAAVTAATTRVFGSSKSISSSTAGCSRSQSPHLSPHFITRTISQTIFKLCLIGNGKKKESAITP